MLPLFLLVSEPFDSLRSSRARAMFVIAIVPIIECSKENELNYSSFCLLTLPNQILLFAFIDRFVSVVLRGSMTTVCVSIFFDTLEVNTRLYHL